MQKNKKKKPQFLQNLIFKPKMHIEGLQNGFCKGVYRGGGVWG